VESDILRLYFPVLDIDFVSADNNGDILTDSDNVSVPVWYILVSKTTGYVEHDDGALSLNASVTLSFNLTALTY
jgi:hypothetical protein